MKGQFWLIAFLVVVLLISIAIIAVGQPAEKWLTVYYISEITDSRTPLTPVKVHVENTLSKIQQAYIILEMLKHPIHPKLWTAVPEALYFIDVTLSGKTIILNLSHDNIAGTAMAGSFEDQLCWSILDIEGIERILFKVKGETVETLTAEGIWVEGGVTRNLESVKIVPFSPDTTHK